MDVGVPSERAAGATIPPRCRWRSDPCRGSDDAADPQRLQAVRDRAVRRGHSAPPRYPREEGRQRELPRLTRVFHAG